MTSFIRALALAATTTGFAVAAQAGAVLGFDDPSLLGTTPGTAYKATYGVSISDGGVIARDVDLPLPRGNGNVGVLLNRVGGQGFTLTIDTTLFDYDLLSFDYSTATGLSYNVTDIGGDDLKGFRVIQAPPSQWQWEHLDVDLSTLGKIKTVEFRVGNGAFVVLDNISFSLSGTSNNVPEPASLALVGLALAGVAASRRRAKA